MGLKTAIAQHDTDASALSDAEAQVVADNATLLQDQGVVDAAQKAITTDDAAIVAALQAGPSPAFVGPNPDGTITVYTLDATQPAGFTVTQVGPAT